MKLWRREDREPASVGDAITDELSQLREVSTPPALVASVMGRIAARPAPSFWAWLHKPMRLAVQISPAGLVALLAATVAAVVLFQMSPRTPIPMTIATETAVPAPAPAPATVVTTPVEPPTSSSVLVRFALRDARARQAAVVGSWNGWKRSEVIMRRATTADLFTATVALPPGEHEYMFVVDGKFVTDPEAPGHRPDGFGNVNAVLRL